MNIELNRKFLLWIISELKDNYLIDRNLEAKDYMFYYKTYCFGIIIIKGKLMSKNMIFYHMVISRKIKNIDEIKCKRICTKPKNIIEFEFQPKNSSYAKFVKNYL